MSDTTTRPDAAPSTPLPAQRSPYGTVVPLGPQDADEVLWVDQAAFPTPLDPGQSLDYFEWDRTFGVRRDGELAGVNTSFSLSLSLPSGSAGPNGAAGAGAAGDAATVAVPMAGLSWVGVHPGHRRRGVLSQMIRHHLHDLHERAAEPVSGLHASEAEIYGRFGYGLATSGYLVKLGRGARLRDLPGSDDVRITFATAHGDEHAGVVARVHALACARRPGMVDRTAALTRAVLRRTPRELERDEPLRILLAERDGEVTGYALVQRTLSWQDGHADGTTQLFEYAALDSVSEHRLWRAVTDFDLTNRTKVWRVALDSPLLAWLIDPRAVSPTWMDQLWLRIVDVDRALAARGYAGAVDVVLEVTDDLCPWNAGRWRLRTHAQGATCERTDDEADLSLDVRELGSALVGGVTLAALATAGLVHEVRPGALASLSQAMRAASTPMTLFAF